jgi:hypothetical protein
MRLRRHGWVSCLAWSFSHAWLDVRRPVPDRERFRLRSRRFAGIGWRKGSSRRAYSSRRDQRATCSGSNELFSCSPPGTGRRRRRRPEVPLPDPAVVELNPHSVRRIDGALVTCVDPDPAGRRSQIGPSAKGFSGFGHKVQLVPVLGDEGWSA